MLDKVLVDLWLSQSSLRTNVRFCSFREITMDLLGFGMLRLV